MRTFALLAWFLALGSASAFAETGPGEPVDPTIRCGDDKPDGSLQLGSKPTHFVPPRSPEVVGQMCSGRELRSYFDSKSDMAFGCGMCCRGSILWSRIRSEIKPYAPPESDLQRCVATCFNCAEPKKDPKYYRIYNLCLKPECRDGVPGYGQCLKPDQASHCPAASGPSRFPAVRAVAKAIEDGRLPIRPAPPSVPTRLPGGGGITAPSPSPETGRCCFGSGTGSRMGVCQAHGLRCPIDYSSTSTLSCAPGDNSKCDKLNVR